MDDNTREKLRPVLYIAAGAYLIYLAVHMLQDLGAMTGTEHTMMLAASILFGIGGVAILIFGIICGKKIFLDAPAADVSVDPDKEKKETSEEQE